MQNASSTSTLIEREKGGQGPGKTQLVHVHVFVFRCPIKDRWSAEEIYNTYTQFGPKHPARHTSYRKSNTKILRKVVNLYIYRYQIQNYLTHMSHGCESSYRVRVPYFMETMWK